jgi:hypothetical protein
MPRTPHPNTRPAPHAREHNRTANFAAMRPPQDPARAAFTRTSAPHDALPPSPMQTLRTLRVVRIVRVLRSLNLVRSVSGVIRLLKALVGAIPTLGTPESI